MRRFLIALSCCFAAEICAAEKFSFLRPVAPGSCFECRITTVQSARYTFKMPGREDPAVKLETVRADFHGYAAIRKVNASGNPLLLRIRSDRLSGSLNGRPVQAVLPSGTWLEADLSGSRARFRCNGEDIARELEVLLQSLFPPASAVTLADLTGLSRVLPSPGEGWKPDLTAFLRLLANRRIDGLSPASFKSGITYYGEDRIGKMKSRKFGLLIETARLTDYDCRFKLTFWLAPSGPPVRLVRDATEIVRRVLRSGPPAAAGIQAEQLCEEHTEQTLLPVEKIPPVKAAPGKNGAWDFLLR